LYNTRIVGARKEGDVLTAVQIASADGVGSKLKSDAYLMCLGA
jgi:hypothetical protein